MQDPGVFRAPLRSRRDDVDHALAVDHALTLGICGVGGVLGQRPATLADALVAVDAAYGERVARRLERFAAAPDEAQVWTRRPAGPFHRGWLTGPWSYDVRPAAATLDLPHVRPCDWDPEPWEEHRVPASVAHTFRRGGRNFQRIRAATYQPPGRSG
ncbi:GAF domain-containing protein [Nocardioides sp. cx-169]|uniref:GAF domain-containing protein n=1 Tax=Nocardioides sp. cx-169 TaxID=2899080 RepID=UPI001E4B01D2|nr:GAF domain-containing protein [Nocardioides sp. cx-169]MCD4535397.1 GAF domain-containing protein [Nocardioides sp. cx-169]